MPANFKLYLQSMLGCSRDRYFVCTGNDGRIGEVQVWDPSSIRMHAASSKAAALADCGKAQGSTKFQRLQRNT